MTLKMSFIVCVTSCWIILIPDQALAWGVGLHITQGIYVLKNLNLITPNIAVILKAFPYDYLYGCISADIFIGKGVKKRWDHCHNWSVGNNMFLKADSDNTISFACGYLSHLAADTISHNFYVPNQLYLTSSTKRFGHIYWESRSDGFINKNIWKIARTVIGRHNLHSDKFLQETVRRKLVSFKMKKRVFTHSIRLNDISLLQKAVTVVSKKSRWSLDKTYIEELNRYSINLVIDFLKKGEKSICFELDPVGSVKLLSAKKKRKEDKKESGSNPERVLFKIPANIKKLSYVKTNIVL